MRLVRTHELVEVEKHWALFKFAGWTGPFRVLCSPSSLLYSYLLVKSGFIEHRLYGRLSARCWSSYTVQNGAFHVLLPLST